MTSRQPTHRKWDPCYLWVILSELYSCMQSRGNTSGKENTFKSESGWTFRRSFWIAIITPLNQSGRLVEHQIQTCRTVQVSSTQNLNLKYIEQIVRSGVNAWGPIIYIELIVTLDKELGNITLNWINYNL